MAYTLNPYLSFRDTAGEAMGFYAEVFGGELTSSTFGEMHASEDPAENAKIMHARLDTPNGMVLMASDTPNGMDLSPTSNITVSLSGDDDTELRGYWARLVEDGQVQLPLEVAPWGDAFGMCVDRFGTTWMVNIGGQGMPGGSA